MLPHPKQTFRSLRQLPKFLCSTLSHTLVLQFPIRSPLNPLKRLWLLCQQRTLPIPITPLGARRDPLAFIVASGAISHVSAEDVSKMRDKLTPLTDAVTPARPTNTVSSLSTTVSSLLLLSAGPHLPRTPAISRLTHVSRDVVPRRLSVALPLLFAPLLKPSTDIRKTKRSSFWR